MSLFYYLPHTYSPSLPPSLPPSPPTHRDVILVVVLEVVEEVHVSEKFLRWSPEVKDLLSGAGWVVDLVWLDVSHDTDGSHYQLHTSRRTLHGLHNGDVCRLGGGEGGGAVSVWRGEGVFVVSVW